MERKANAWTVYRQFEWQWRIQRQSCAKGLLVMQCKLDKQDQTQAVRSVSELYKQISEAVLKFTVLSFEVVRCCA